MRISHIAVLFIAGLWVFQASDVLAGINDFTLQSRVDQTDSGFIRTTTVSLTRTQNNEIMRNQNDIRYMMERALDRARTFMAQAKSQLSNRMSNRDDLSAKVREIREKTEMLKERQKMMLQWQQQRLKDMQQSRETMARR